MDEESRELQKKIQLRKAILSYITKKPSSVEKVADFAVVTKRTLNNWLGNTQPGRNWWPNFILMAEWAKFNETDTDTFLDAAGFHTLQYYQSQLSQELQDLQEKGYKDNDAPDTEKCDDYRETLEAAGNAIDEIKERDSETQLEDIIKSVEAQLTQEAESDQEGESASAVQTASGTPSVLKPEGEEQIGGNPSIEQNWGESDRGGDSTILGVPVTCQGVAMMVVLAVIVGVPFFFVVRPFMDRSIRVSNTDGITVIGPNAKIYMQPTTSFTSTSTAPFAPTSTIDSVDIDSDEVQSTRTIDRSASIKPNNILTSTATVIAFPTALSTSLLSYTPISEVSTTAVFTAVPSETLQLMLTPTLTLTATKTPLFVSDRSRAEAHKERGNDYYERGEYSSAILEYTQAFQIDPNYAAIYHNLGNVYVKLEDYEQALVNYTQAIYLDSSNAASYYSRGFVYSNQGEYGLAIADYTQALVLEPEDADTYKKRADAYYEQGEYRLSADDYNEAIKLDSANYQYHGDYCRNFTLIQQVSEVIENCDKAVELAPEEEKPLYRQFRGVARSETGDNEGAMEDFWAYLRFIQKLNPFGEPDMSVYCKFCPGPYEMWKEQAAPEKIEGPVGKMWQSLRNWVWVYQEVRDGDNITLGGK